jgi:predicted Fe-Mo cluster-binding NifX family protein
MPLRIAVTTRGPGPEFEVDECFGRAYWLLIYEVENGLWTAIDNSGNRNALENAGLLACQQLIDHKANLLLTGQAGPKAFRILSAAGIAIHLGISGSAQEAVHMWQHGAYRGAMAANATGNPNCLVGKVSGLAMKQRFGMYFSAPKNK